MAQGATDEKTNAITAIIEILQLIDLKDAIGSRHSSAPETAIGSPKRGTSSAAY
ncbi:hypothetical protein [Rubinisphaera italica]|uniref:hypothetical protein n=1 Tax=Rubinisphaera italica TaxID=2527969 RepID=UPI0013EF5453|nr:hypothetical protein [Rubinisphaera italica]